MSTLTLVHKPDAKPRSLPRFPHHAANVSPVAYKVTAHEPMRRWVLAVFDRYPNLKPRVDDDEIIRAARRWAATQALILRAGSLTMVEQGLLFQVARAVYWKLALEATDDLSDRLADRALNRDSRRLQVTQ